MITIKFRGKDIETGEWLYGDLIQRLGYYPAMERLISWMIYSVTFCFLFVLAGLELPAREIIAYSLMLGLVAGYINNIERVMRELFKKED